MNIPFSMLFRGDTAHAEAGIRRLAEMTNSLKETMAGMGEALKETFSKVAEFGIHAGKGIIDVAASIEHSGAMLKFAYRDMFKDANGRLVFDQASEGFDRVKAGIEDASLYTMQTQQELTDMVAVVKRVSKADIFDPHVQAALSTAAKANNVQFKNSAVLLAEVGSGLRNQYDLYEGLTYMMQGQAHQAGRLWQMNHQQIAEYERAMAGATTNTDKFAKIVPLLVRDFGALTSVLNHTWQFMTHQIDDIKGRMLATFGQPMIDELKRPLGSFIDYFTNPETGLLTHENIGRLDGMKEAFRQIGASVANAATRVGVLAKSMFEFTMQHPVVIKIAAAVVGIAGAVASIASGLAALRIGVMALGFAFEALWLAPVIAVVATLGVGLYYLAKMKLGGEDIGDVFERIGLVIGAAYEGLTHMSGGVAMISGETARAVGDKGLMGVVTWIIQMGYRVEQFFTGIYDGVLDMSGYISDAFSGLAKAIDGLFDQIGESTGLSAKTSSKSWHDIGEEVGKVIGTMVGLFTKFVTFVTEKLPPILDLVVKIAEKIGKGVQAVKEAMGLTEKDKDDEAVHGYIDPKTGQFVNTTGRNGVTLGQSAKARGLALVSTIGGLTGLLGGKGYGERAEDFENEYGAENAKGNLDTAAWKTRAQIWNSPRQQAVYNEALKELPINQTPTTLDQIQTNAQHLAALEKIQELLKKGVTQNPYELQSQLAQMGIYLDGVKVGQVMADAASKNATRTGNQAPSPSK